MRKTGIITSYLTPVTLCIMVSLGFVRLFLSSGFNQSLPKIVSGGLFEQLVFTLLMTAIGLLGVTGLYWLITSSRAFELRVLMAIVVAPTSAILLIVLSQTVLMVFAKVVSSLITSLIVLASLYVAIFSVIFIMTDAFSTQVRSLIFTFYGALLGSFVSLLLPTVSLVVLLITVALYDLIVINYHHVFPMLHDLSLTQNIASRFGYTGKHVEVGIGELIYYSFLLAHVEAYYGLPLLMLTLAMTLVGIGINVWMLTKKAFLPGLPAPIFLGLLPLILSILFVS